MKFTIVKDYGRVRTVSMDRPKANALHEGLVRDLTAAFREAADRDSVHAVVLTSAFQGYFSVGFDVREVFDYDRDRMIAFWRNFTDLYEAIYDFPKPVIAALSGHTFAGGIILAFACDFRVMARGPYGLGVSGINLGIPLPRSVMNMAVNAIGPGFARRLFLTGETITPDQALGMGLVSQLTSEGDLQNAALTLAQTLGEKSPGAFRAIHRMFDEMSGRDALGNAEDRLQEFVGFWFTPEAHAIRERVRAKFDRGA